MRTARLAAARYGGASPYPVSGTTSAMANAQRHPRVSPMAGTASPDRNTDSGTAAAWMPKANPWRCTGTPRATMVLVPGPAIVRPMAPTARAASRAQ